MNLLLETDSYKLTHWNQYPEGTRGVYSYLEAREGARYPNTLFFGLQPILDRLAQGFSIADVHDADDLAYVHFGQHLFNEVGWFRLLEKHGGRLPVRIKAIPEGAVVPTGNVLMTVENTDEEFPWLTNYIESLLLHVWYPSTVATVSYHVKQMMMEKLVKSGADPTAPLLFMLHDFGFRGATTTDGAAIGGAGHLVSFLGTDNLPAMQLAMRSYGADPASLAFSVPATEHSVMTALGRAGEPKIVLDLLDAHRSGILSVVADSFDIYQFVQRLAKPEFRDRIIGRDGVFVVRPDSVTLLDSTPEALCVRLLGMLWEIFGGTTTSKGFRVLDSHVRLLWGDGIDTDGIEKILNAAMRANYSAENLVFGMGGGLLQKVNRDTQRFAFKCSAQLRNGVWRPVEKETLGKRSRSGRLKLIRASEHGSWLTTRRELAPNHKDELETVFENGEVVKRQTFAEIRGRAK